MKDDKVCFVHNLSSSYGDDEVLAGVSLEANPGEMLVLAGPNGSGKTSLLRVLAGLEEPGKGVLRLFGRDAQNFSRKERSRRIAYVPQLVPDDLPFTVSQAVMLGRSPWQNRLGIGSARDAEVARESMRLAAVEHLGNRHIRQLSGGERQRTAIARALCQEPELFLLDEPTAALDYGHQIHIMDMLNRLCQERKLTLIIASHDINLAAMYADRLLLMRDGKVVALGAPEDVLTLETVSMLYRCPMLVDKNPRTRTPRLSPLPMTASYLSAQE